MKSRYSIALFFCLHCTAFSKTAEPLPNTMAIPVEIRTDRNGMYESGDWTYVMRITLPGTRSEGRAGTLSSRGTTVPDLPETRKGDWVQTPWGKMIWNGRDGDAWIPKGWFLSGVGYFAGNGREFRVEK
ncbi:MAG: hypothetical protein AB7E95_14490 [Kiritimatiellales bacterium]